MKEVMDEIVKVLRSLAGMYEGHNLSRYGFFAGVITPELVGKVVFIDTPTGPKQGVVQEVSTDNPGIKLATSIYKQSELAEQGSVEHPATCWVHISTIHSITVIQEKKVNLSVKKGLN